MKSCFSGVREGIELTKKLNKKKNIAITLLIWQLKNRELK